jgi:hypothetical protein
MMNSSECCAGSHHGEPRPGGFYSGFDRVKKTYLESGIKASARRFAHRVCSPFSGIENGKREQTQLPGINPRVPVFAFR